MKPWRSFGALPYLFFVLVACGVAWACQTPSPQQIENALQASPNLNSALKSCSMAAMLTKESGGNTCAANSCCVGIGQLNVNTSAGGLDLSQYGMTRSQYQDADLQTQINIWSVQANMNTQSSGYQTLNNAYKNGQPLDGTPVTPGMLAACEQFGAAVCNHNVSSLQSTGACGSYTDGNGHTGGQTICSWGATADKQAANQNCANGTQTTPTQPANCPSPSQQDSGTPAIASNPTSGATVAASPLPSTASQPSVASTDVIVSGTQI